MPIQGRLRLYHTCLSGLSSSPEVRTRAKTPHSVYVDLTLRRTGYAAERAKQIIEQMTQEIYMNVIDSN